MSDSRRSNSILPGCLLGICLIVGCSSTNRNSAESPLVASTPDATWETSPDSVQSDAPVFDIDTSEEPDWSWQPENPTVVQSIAEQPSNASRQHLSAADSLPRRAHTGRSLPGHFHSNRIRLDGRASTSMLTESGVTQTSGEEPAESTPSTQPVAPQPNPEVLPLPLRGLSPEPDIELTGDGQLISLSVRDAPLNSVLSLIAEHQGVNIVTGSDMTSPVTVTLHEVTLEQALNSILRIAGCAWFVEGDIIYVTSVKPNAHVDPNVQGRELRVFQLDYVSATDVEKVVRSLLSPAGNIVASESDSKNRRRTGESVVVEDLPRYLRRIEQYVAQIDQPPRQVLIEAHILEVKLSDNMTHGVNFDYLAEISNTKLRLETTGFANPLAGSGMLFSVDGSDLSSLVEALQNTNDAKTLASPKVLALNGQEARIQIGERLGYFVTTTTQTSTLQQVQFLDVGIVLRVTPQITADGRIIMAVQPEISTGAINDTTGLPDKATTEVETSVILNDGRGIIIGGLIQEADTDRQSKVPFVGDIWAIGRAFQRRVGARDRSEIIVVLVPRIVPCSGGPQGSDEIDVHRATTPLLDKNLKRYPRPAEGALPDAMKDPRRLKLKLLPNAIRNLDDPYPLPPEYYLPATSEGGEYDPAQRFDPQQVPVFEAEPTIPYEDFHYAE